MSFAPSYDEVPKTIKHYEVLRELNHGSFGLVVEAVNKKTNQKFALKIVSREKLLKHDQLHCLEQELRIQKLLHHPNILTLIEIIYLSEYIVMVEELCCGDLFSIIELPYDLSSSILQKMFSELIDAISYIHNRGIAHRDLKPENVLFDSNYHIKISDFGCCEVNGKIWNKNYYGTIVYSPPEIFSNSIYDSKKADIWALGLIIFLLLVHHYPWKEGEFRTRFLKIPQIISQITPSSQYGQILHMCLEINPDKRSTSSDLQNLPWVQEVLKSEKLLKNSLVRSQSMPISQAHSLIHNIGLLTVNRDRKNIYPFLKSFYYSPITP